MSSLIVRYRQGDSEAAGEAVDRYGATAYALATAVLDDGARAEDAVAEGFTFAFQHSASFDPAYDDEARWLLASVRRQALIQLREGRRRRRRRRERDDDELEAGITASMPHGLTAEAVALAFRGLRPAQREALSFGFLHGMDASEVGRRVGIAEETANGRIRSGLIDLMDQLSQAEAVP